MNVSESIKQEGDIEIIIDYINGKQERRYMKNTILKTAKVANAKGLVNDISTPFDYYIEKMIFGTNGTVGDGTPKFVEDSRNGLFGTTLLSKNIISSLNDQAQNQAIFTAVITFSEGNGNIINEMALKMKNGDLYSMVTHGGITKTSSMQITFNWRLSFV